MALTFSSCDPDPVVPNQDELITSVIVTLSPALGGKQLELQYTDLDGDGGNSPIIKVDTFSISATYFTKVQFLNQSGASIDDISLEVKNESEDHQVFYTPSNPDFIKVVYLDLDKNGKPLGLDVVLSTFTTKGKGELTLSLIHKPNKSASNVAAGDKTNAGGETDIEISFPIVIK
jgi:hypothetical protein